MDSRNRDKSPVHRKSDYKHRDRDIHSSRDKDSRDIPTSRDIHRNSHREIDRDSREIEHQHSNEKNIIKEVPNFAKSGSLNKDFLTFNGVLLKYAQPLEARVPEEKGKRLFVFKKDKHLDTIDISKQSGNRGFNLI